MIAVPWVFPLPLARRTRWNIYNHHQSLYLNPYQSTQNHDPEQQVHTYQHIHSIHVRTLVRDPINQFQISLYGIPSRLTCLHRHCLHIYSLSSKRLLSSTRNLCSIFLSCSIEVSPVSPSNLDIPTSSICFVSLLQSHLRENMII